MASRVSIAIRQREATDRLSAAFEMLAALWGTDVVDLAPHSKDAAMGRALQLEAIASQAEAFVAALQTQPQVEPELQPEPMPVVRTTRRRPTGAL